MMIESFETVSIGQNKIEFWMKASKSLHNVSLDIDYIATFNQKPTKQLDKSKAIMEKIELAPEFLAMKLDNRLVMNASGQTLNITPIND